MIAIPNMDMPKSCEECSLCYDYLCCSIDDSLRMCLYNRHPNCPLIEIDLVRCGECKKVDTKKCPMYSAGWGYTDDDWCSEGERRE